MRSLSLLLVLIISSSQVLAYDDPYYNRAAGQNFARQMQQTMQQVNVPTEHLREASQAMDLITDPNAMGNAFEMMNQMTKPIQVTKAECEAMAKQMAKAMDMVEKMDPNDYAADSEPMDMDEIKRHMNPNHAETRQGIDHMRKLMSCQKMGYIQMETNAQFQ